METPYAKDLEISLRDFYVEGAGQLCRKCHEVKDVELSIVANLIKEMPNDAELGAKVRELYNIKRTNI